MTAAPQVLLLGGNPFNFYLHTLIFTHVPKCGGTSLHETFAGIFGDRYRVFCGKPDEQQGISGLRGAGGHQRFGKNPLHRRKTPLVYTTVIREPFEQFISYYHHIHRVPGHPLRLMDPDIIALSPVKLIDHLEKIGNRSVINPQADMLAPDATTAAEAIEQIEQHYSLIGTLESIDIYIKELMRMFPDKRIRTYTLNTASRWPSLFQRLNPSLRRRVYEISEIDCAVYEHFSARR